MVHGVEIVEIEAAVGQARRVLAVDEIVVGREEHGAETTGHQLDRYAVAESGLARRAGTGDENEPDRRLGTAVAALDFLGDLDNLLLLQGLGDLYELAGAALETGAVDVTDVRQADDAVPFERLGEDLESLGLVLVEGEDVRVVTVGDAEEDAVAERLKGPDLEVAGARDETVVEEVGRAVKGVVLDIDVAAGLQELDLVLVTEAAEEFDGLFDGDFVAVEGDVLLDDFLHAGTYGGDVFGRQGGAVRLGEVAEIPLRQRPAHRNLAAGEDVQARLRKQKTKRTRVHTASAVSRIVEELDGSVLVNSEFQSLGDIVDLGRDDREGPVEPEGVEHLDQGGPFGEFRKGLGVLAIDPEHLDAYLG